VREHEIYIVGDSAAAFDMARSGMADRAAATNPRNKKPDSVAATPKAPRAKPAPTGQSSEQDGATNPALHALLQDRKKLTIAGGALGAVVLVLAILVATKKSDAPKLPDSTSVAAAPSTAQVGERPKEDAAKPVDSKDAAAPIATDATKSTPSAQPAASPAVAPTGATGAKPDTAKADDRKLAKPEPTKSEPAKADANKPDAGKEAAKPAPVVQGTVNFAIQPWGEVLVNGRSIGVSPPLKQHRLAPGKYKIEVRNSTFTPLVTTVDVKAKEDVNIRHQFK
jgi:hypothetical protein